MGALRRLNQALARGFWATALRRLAEARGRQLRLSAVSFNSVQRRAPWRRSLELLREMRRRSLLPDAFGVSSACGRLPAEAWFWSLSLLDVLETTGEKADVVLLSACAPRPPGAWPAAVALLAAALRRGLRRDAALHRAALAPVRRAPWRRALELLRAMPQARLRLSLRVASGTLGAVDSWRRGLALRAALVAGGVGWDAVAGNLVAGCSGAGSWAWAVQCLAGAVWDEVSFGIALDCCAQGRLWSEAAGLCVRLRQRGKAPRAGAFGAAAAQRWAEAISLLRWLALGRVEGGIGSVALRSHSRPEQATFSSQNRMQLRPEGTYQPSPKRPQLRFVLSPARIRPGQQRTEEGAEVRHRLKKSQAPEELLGCFEVALQEGVVDASVVGAALQRCGHSLWWKALLEVYDAKEHLGIRLSCMEQSIVFSALASCVRPHVLTEPRRRRALEIAREVWKEAVPEADPDFNCVLSSALKLCFQLRSEEATQWAETLWEWSEGEIFQKSIVTYSSWLLLLERLQRRDKVDVMLSKVLQGDVRPNAVLLGGLLNIAAELRDWRRADALWQLGKTRHVKVNGLAHAAYAKAHFLSGRPGAGLEILHRMVASGAGEDYQDYRYAVDFLQMQVVVCHSAPSPANLARLRGFLPKGRGLLGACPGSGLQCWERLEQVAQRLLAQPSSVSFEEVLVTWPAQRDSVMKDWQAPDTSGTSLPPDGRRNESGQRAANHEPLRRAPGAQRSLLHEPDLAMLNAAIAAGQRGQAWIQCLELLRAGVQPDAVSRNSAGAALAAAGRWRKAMALKGDTCTEVTLGVLGRACREAQASCGALGGVPGARRPGQLGDEMAPTWASVLQSQMFHKVSINLKQGPHLLQVADPSSQQLARAAASLGIGSAPCANCAVEGAAWRWACSPGLGLCGSPAWALWGVSLDRQGPELDLLRQLEGLKRAWTSGMSTSWSACGAWRRRCWRYRTSRPSSASSGRPRCAWTPCPCRSGLVRPERFGQWRDGVKELPPWFWERQNITRRPPGVDLLSLDGRRAIWCCAEAVQFEPVRRFLRLARWVYKATECVVVTSSPDVLSAQSKSWLLRSKAKRKTLPATAPRRSARLLSQAAQETRTDASDPPLRPCQRDCLEACAKGARVIEMACGTGKTRVMKELVRNIAGRVLVTVPLRALLEQFAEDFPDFCKVGTGYNQDIDFAAKGFLAVTDSVRMLKGLEFDAIFVDEAHHPLPAGFPKSQVVYRFSATHRDEPDFRYSMGQAMEDRILCDYDLIVPVVTPQHGHTFLSLAGLLLKQAGRFRRVLAYCNSVREAKSFRMVLRKLGMAAWHMNGGTPAKKRQDILERFSSALQAPVNVLVTVEVLGEGINIPNADTCMFVEPRGSYRSIVQALGRVLRPHPAKPLAHIVLPAVALTQNLKRDSLPPAFIGRNAPALYTSAGLLDPSGTDSARRPAQNGWAAQGDQKPFTHQVDDGLATLSRRMQGDGDEYLLHEKQGQEDKRFLRSKRAQTWQSSTLVEISENGAPQPDTSTAEQIAARSSSRFPDMVAASAVDARTVVSAGHVAIPNWGTAAAVSHLAAEGPPAMVARPEAANRHANCASNNAAGHEFQTNSSNAMTDGAPRPADVAFSTAVDDGGMRRKGGKINGGAAAVQPDLKFDSPSAIAKAVGYPTDAAIRMQPIPGGRHGCQQLEAERRASQCTGQQRFTHVRKANLGNGFRSQLQRFFAALVQADHRLLGPGQAFGHRVQVVDCTTALCYGLNVDEVTRAVHAELAEVLRNQDAWQARFADVLRFASVFGRLPKETAQHSEERSLAFWLATQGTRLRANRMLPHRFHQLLNASSHLLRERVQGWLELGQAFEQKCQALREHIEATGSLPQRLEKTGSRHKLATWLYRQSRLNLSTYRRKMLEGIHPLVRKMLRRLAKKPLRMNAKLWQRRRRELLEFVSKEGHLPSEFQDSALFYWLKFQHLRLRRGQLPAEWALELQSSHPLIAEHLQRQPRNTKAIG
ncbi:unnamed protein product [Effrenium voratum]|uniref:Uncharacterized protein n=1 Tax=Effrenium voratum TaxID=2562239 RepID=A0AA36NBA3_9DINO|nr:unnamed protein product [Effrenium voratum]